MAASASPSKSPSVSPSQSPSASKSPSVSPSASPSYGITDEKVSFVGAAVGNVQSLNVGSSDDGEPIYYELETQELEFGNRALLKSITDKLTVIGQNLYDSKIDVIEDQHNARPISITLDNRINSTTIPNLKAYYLTFRWSGNTNNKSPILEEFSFNNIKNDGFG